MSFTWDEADPLARAKGETAVSNAALRDYALMGPGRSLAKLRQKYGDRTAEIESPTLSLRVLERWSSRYDWQARIVRFEELQAETELEKWEERRRQLAENDWQHGGELRQKVLDFLRELPRFVTTSEAEMIRDGQRIRVITVALNTTLSQIAQALKVADDLQRLAADEPTAHFQFSGAALDAIIERELARLAYGRQAGAGSSADPDGPDGPASVRPPDDEL